MWSLKKSSKPECTDNQSERFKQAARELGCDDGEALERAFGKIVPPRRPSKDHVDKNQNDQEHNRLKK
jgi:hypothetical protein